MIAASGSSLSPRLLHAYRRTEYRSGEAVARIGRRSAQIDAVLRAMGARRGAFLTAWNPASRRLPAAMNRRRQDRLTALLRRMPWRAAEGGWRGWREAHVLAAGDPRRLATLARRFGQNAIVAIAMGRAARLVLLR